jgi:hypothetical protein
MSAAPALSAATALDGALARNPLAVAVPQARNMSLRLTVDIFLLAFDFVYSILLLARSESVFQRHLHFPVILRCAGDYTEVGHTQNSSGVAELRLVQ